MRCVNAWKTDDDMTRINKLEVGNIIDTLFTIFQRIVKYGKYPKNTKQKLNQKNPNVKKKQNHLIIKTLNTL